MAADIWSWLWDVIVIFFTAFVFITALSVVITVIVDLFRDHTLKGWQKALWVIFFVFFPLFSSLIYLIFRGPGMARRARERDTAAKSAADSYIRDVAQAGPVDQIARAKELLDAGAISADDFEKLKSKALSAA